MIWRGGLRTGKRKSFSRVRARWNYQLKRFGFSTAYAERLQQIEGVESTVPVIRYITPNAKGRLGIQQIDGIDWQPFAEMNDMQIVEGRAATANDEVILDERQMRDDKRKARRYNRAFRQKHYKVVGVFSPPSGSRIKMSLAAMQDALEAAE